MCLTQQAATIIGASITGILAVIGIYFAFRNNQRLQRKANLERRASDREKRLQDAYKEFIAGLFARIYVALEYMQHLNGVSAREHEEEIAYGPPTSFQPSERDVVREELIGRNLLIVSRIRAAYALVLLLDTDPARAGRATSLLTRISEPELSDLDMNRENLERACADYSRDLGFALEDQYFEESDRAERGERPHRAPRVVALSHDSTGKRGEPGHPN